MKRRIVKAARGPSILALPREEEERRLQRVEQQVDRQRHPQVARALVRVPEAEREQEDDRNRPTGMDAGEYERRDRDREPEAPDGSRRRRGIGNWTGRRTGRYL